MSSCCSLDEDALDFKKRSLKDAILCIGWFKMMSVTFYICMYYLTKFTSDGFLLPTLLLLILIGIIPSVFLGMMLFLGALQECAGAVITALITCYALATYDLLVGMTGAGYHVMIAHDMQDVILTLAFILLSLTSLPAYCHDAFIINAYRKVLSDDKCDEC